jgi:hypothetical protein
MDIKAYIKANVSSRQGKVYTAQKETWSMQAMLNSLRWSLEGEDGRWQDLTFPTILDVQPREDGRPHQMGFDIYPFLNPEVV